MAWRSLWRQPRRTGITLSSIVFGVMLAVIMTGITDANFAEMIDLAARLGGGHVTLQHPDYLDAPTFAKTVQGGALRDAALRDGDVRRVVTRISGQLMLSTAERSYGAGFIAFDPAAEDASTLSLIDAIAEGRPLESAADRGVVIGQRLAENLGLGLGRKVVFTLTDKHGEIVRDVARVSGLLRTGSPSIDGALVLFGIDRMRQVLGYAPEEAIQVALFLDDQRAAETVAARFEDELAGGAASLPWNRAQPDLANFIAIKVAGGRFMEAVVMLLVAAGIFNTLLVSVMERLREFGIMLALGFSPGALFRVVMYESLWLALVGLGLGALVTAGPYWYLATTGFDALAAMGGSGSEIAGVAVTGRMYAGIYPEHALAIGAAAVAATLLAGVYPALKAGRVHPVETIRLG
jgi:ABC-type lipoprotein release transport system permease subunit